MITENDDLRSKNKELKGKIDVLETNEKVLAKKNHDKLEVRYYFRFTYAENLLCLYANEIHL